ncbi:aminotransferase class I/II-fold pyridoxal phosphate-dependent enzyme [Deinococcus aquaedulcis]|uniref:aminotransferase class I/II-fold pyridoxal phosphate-dependent enzyme n=1 Tax=Deinococcus aquaedulcis TaxID=2840455 RepID=UPI001C834543|nr:histidinol-phosphate transaminase [Deinococcus aquaedulcis]
MPEALHSDLPPLVPRAPHGGPTATAFTGLDFSVNTNPYGPNPALLRAVRDADHADYPDPSYRWVREALAHWHGVTPDEVALSVGASDLLHRLARAFVPPGGTLLSLHAPFGELARAAALARAEVLIVSERPDRVPPGTALVYVGQPHNPTGHTLSPLDQQALAQTCAQAGALLIVDEAYAPFLAPGAPAGDGTGPRHPATVRLLSPGKAHGLVGARPAYALAAPEVVARLDNLAPAWHLPAGTAALLAALPPAQGFLAATLPRVQAEAQALARALGELGPVAHHGTPYLTLAVEEAPAVAAALLAQGLRVRDCSSYGLPGHLRVSTRTPAQNAVLVRALQSLI